MPPHRSVFADAAAFPQRAPWRFWLMGGLFASLFLGWRRCSRRRAEEAHLFQQILDFFPWQVFVKDPEGRYVMDNVVHRRFMRKYSTKNALGHRAGDFFPEEMASLYIKDDRQIMKTGQPMIDFEEPVITRSGQFHWRVMNKGPLYDRRGRLVGLVGHCHDISGQKTDAERYRLAVDQLEQCHGELRDFTAIASHDLQEPLRKVRTFADRLQQRCGGRLDPAGREDLERLSAAARHAQVLVQNLLTLSQLSGSTPRLVPVELSEVLKRIVGELQPAIRSSGAAVEVSPLPAIRADPAQMEQLFGNLLGNALKFHKPGRRPVVSVSARILRAQDYSLAGAEPGDAVCQIRITDNGIGFAPAFSEQIFSLFKRLHRAEYEGTGIGLPVCRKIVLLHGGSITAKGAEGEGATFLVMLPVAPRNPGGVPTEP